MEHPSTILPLPLASGEKAKARDILTTIRTLQRIEQGQRPATPDERQALGRFPGFGPGVCVWNCEVTRLTGGRASHKVRVITINRAC